MKKNRKIILTIIGVLSYLFSYAQLNVSLPKNISLQLPKGTELYNDSASSNRLADNLGINRKRLNKNTYKFKDMVLKFWTINSSIGKDYLKEEKQRLEFDFKKEAVLKTVNGNHVLVDIYLGEKTSFCKFHCLNPEKTKGFIGSISFKTLQNNKEYYLNIIEEMLKTVKFEE